MGTTPIYGFPYPDPSDLVANYPALGQELAEDIEAVLPTLGGLTLIDEETFTTVSSVSLNNVFTNDYENYRILVSIKASSAASANLNVRLRAAGSDDSTNINYGQGAWDVNYSGGSGQAAIANSGAICVIPLGSASADSRISLDLFAPQLTEKTYSVWGSNWYDSANLGTRMGSNTHRNATSFDGFSLVPSTGTINGVVRVYGYKGA